MAGLYIDDRLWETVIGPGQFDFDSPIYKYWRALKQADPPQYLGVPVTPEIQTEIGLQQGFASGAVLGWTPEGGAYIAND